MVSTALLHKIELAFENRERTEHLVREIESLKSEVQKLQGEIKAMKARMGKKVIPEQKEQIDDERRTN